MIRKTLCAVLAFGVCAMAGPASASPDLSSEWGQASSELYEQTVAAMQAGAVPDGFEAGTARFAVTATRLGDWAETSGAAADLACIFRGMAEEAEAQLDALDAGEAPEQALQRLAILFSDAEAIAAAAVHASRRSRGPDAARQVPTCPASPSTAQYLTEQP